MLPSSGWVKRRIAHQNEYVKKKITYLHKEVFLKGIADL
jgi:hypothetical protein